MCVVPLMESGSVPMNRQAMRKIKWMAVFTDVVKG